MERCFGRSVPVRSHLAEHELVRQVLLGAQCNHVLLVRFYLEAVNMQLVFLFVFYILFCELLHISEIAVKVGSGQKEKN